VIPRWWTWKGTAVYVYINEILLAYNDSDLDANNCNSESGVSSGNCVSENL